VSEQFPSEFPIFPLPDVVLFPEVRLPLHLFEPRYRAMMERALEGESVIGMLLVRPHADPMQARAPVFDVGCAGRITDWKKLDDGRFQLILTGERRFRLLHDELAAGGFRMAQAELLTDPSFDELDGEQRAGISTNRARIETLTLALARRTAPRAVDMLRDQMMSLDPLELIHALSFSLDCAPLEKQGLLETSDPLERSHLLIGLLEFREAEQRLPGAPTNVN
jgi:Lon protease-like protein